MTYHFVDHTADVAADLTGGTLDELFASAAAALTDTITDASNVHAKEDLPLTLSAQTLDDLLVDWVNELLYLFEVRQFLSATADVRVSTGATPRLDAVAHGETVDPARHPIRVLVKGATYHALHVREGAHGWQARIVFDI